MKVLLSVILLAAVAFAQTNPAADSSQQIPVDQENAHKAKVLLDQAIEALGGQAYVTISRTSPRRAGLTAFTMASPAALEFRFGAFIVSRHGPG